MKTPHPDRRQPAQRTSLGHGCRYDGRPRTLSFLVWDCETGKSWGHHAETRRAAREEYPEPRYLVAKR